MTKKLTNKTALQTILDSTFDFTSVDFTNDEIREKLADMLSALENRKAATKPTKNQQENEGYIADIRALLMDGHARTVSDIIKEIFSDKGLSNQRVTAIVKMMMNANEVKKEIIKGKAMFSLM